MTDWLLIVPALVLLVLAVVAYFVFASFFYGAGYQPTPRRVVERMLELAEVGPSDRLVDLGAGTGAILFRAARVRGAEAVGVEVEPIRVLILRLRRRLGPARERITVDWGDLFRRDYRTTTVVTAFLWPDAMRRLRPILEEQLAPGARVVSYYHPVPGWTAAATDPELKVFLYQR